jgi:DNA repair exonuclease SbcCD ATPase subunit/DNA repair exonuclease SbcCD nuclease subunit
MRPKKIFHLGDQHFFLSKKFQEHQFVCDKFYEDLEREKPDLCVMTGDLIDSKLRLGPEQFDLARNFLLNVTNYCPVIIILGNHDLNMQNKERLDAISPILYSIYNDVQNPIHFLKNSGIYNLYEIDWAVWGVLDDQKNPFDEPRHKNDITKDSFIIGLFHGAVAGCITESGYRMNSGIDIKEFNQCDIVMMSDIHQVQSFRNNEIQYSGSFLQTKTSEAEEGTYIQWDWNGKTYKPKVCKLENIYSTISERIPDDLSDIKINAFSKDQTILLKYDVEAVSKVEANEYKKKLEAKYGNVVELKPVIKKKLKLKNEETEEREVIDIKQYFLEYITKNQEYLELKDIGEDTKKILALEEQYSTNLDISKDFELGDFTLQRVVLNNLLSFGPKDTIIELNLDGIVGINAPNTTGKSNIFRALQFILFNSTPNNTSSLKRLINKHNRNKPAVGELFLTKNGRFYLIRRTLTPKKSEGVSILLEFMEIDADGNELQNLSGEKRQETEKEIQKLFGIESMFEILSIFSAQKKQTEFIDCKNAERLTLVNRFLGLQSFELKEKEVAEQLKADKAVFNALMKEFNSNIKLSDLEDELLGIEKLQVERTPLVETYEENLENHILKNEGLLELYEELKVGANKKVVSPEEIKEQNDAIDNEIKKKQKEIISHETSLVTQTESLDNIKSKFKKDVGVGIQSYTPDYKKTKSAENELAVIYSDLARYNKQIKIDVCVTCSKPFSEKDKEKTKKLISEHEERVEELEAIVEKETKKLDSIVDQQNEYNKLGRTMSNTQNTILSLKNDLERLEVKKSKIISADDEYKAVEKAKKGLLKLEPQIAEYKTEKFRLEGLITNLKFELKDLKNRTSTLKKEIEHYKLKLQELAAIEEELRILKTYKDIIHKDGLPLYILKTKMASVNRQINLIVSQVFNFELEFAVDEDAGDLNINFIYEGDADTNDVALASGAETFIINLCIKVGLSQISELPKMSSLLIDEGYGTLDPETIDKIPVLFAVLSEYYKNIITVSHLDSIKDMCQHQIKLKKVNGYTEILN